MIFYKNRIMEKNLVLYVIFLLLLHSCSNTNQQLLKVKPELKLSSKYYKDYDIYQMKGINLLELSDLQFPYIEENIYKDSIVIVYHCNKEIVTSEKYILTDKGYMQFYFESDLDTYLTINYIKDNTMKSFFLSNHNNNKIKDIDIFFQDASLILIREEKEECSKTYFFKSYIDVNRENLSEHKEIIEKNACDIEEIKRTYDIENHNIKEEKYYNTILKETVNIDCSYYPKGFLNSSYAGFKMLSTATIIEH
jgi:hypothetical protein